MQRISVTLPDEIADLFYAKVTKGDRSRFVTEAIKLALMKENKAKAYKALVDFKPFEVSEDSVEVLDNIRRARMIKTGEKG